MKRPRSRRPAPFVRVRTASGCLGDDAIGLWVEAGAFLGCYILGGQTTTGTSPPSGRFCIFSRSGERLIGSRAGESSSRVRPHRAPSRSRSASGPADVPPPDPAERSSGRANLPNHSRISPAPTRRSPVQTPVLRISHASFLPTAPCGHMACLELDGKPDVARKARSAGGPAALTRDMARRGRASPMGRDDERHRSPGWMRCWQAGAPRISAGLAARQHEA